MEECRGYACRTGVGIDFVAAVLAEYLHVEVGVGHHVAEVAPLMGLAVDDRLCDIDCASEEVELDARQTVHVVVEMSEGIVSALRLGKAPFRAEVGDVFAHGLLVVHLDVHGESLHIHAVVGQGLCRACGVFRLVTEVAAAHHLGHGERKGSVEELRHLYAVGLAPCVQGIPVGNEHGFLVQFLPFVASRLRERCKLTCGEVFHHCLPCLPVAFRTKELLLLFCRLAEPECQGFAMGGMTVIIVEVVEEDGLRCSVVDDMVDVHEEVVACLGVGDGETMERLTAEQVEGAHVGTVEKLLSLIFCHRGVLDVGLHSLVAPLHGHSVLHAQSHEEVGVVVDDAFQGIGQQAGIDAVGEPGAEPHIIFCSKGLVHPFEEDAQLRLE